MTVREKQEAKMKRMGIKQYELSRLINDTGLSKRKITPPLVNTYFRQNALPELSPIIDKILESCK